MSASDVAVTGLINQFTGVFVTAGISLVLAIVTFIQHHSTNPKVESATKDIARLMAKAEQYDQELAANKQIVGTAVDALTNMIPQLNKMASDHSGQITNLQAQLAAMAKQMQEAQAALSILNSVTSNTAAAATQNIVKATPTLQTPAGQAPSGT